MFVGTNRRAGVLAAAVSARRLKLNRTRLVLQSNPPVTEPHQWVSGPSEAKIRAISSIRAQPDALWMIPVLGGAMGPGLASGDCIVIYVSRTVPVPPRDLLDTGPVGDRREAD